MHGLYYYRARYYDPNAGRFLSEDEMQFFAGGTNFYAYSFNNPGNLSDPSGLAPGLLDKLLNWWKPTSAPPPSCPPAFNCDSDGYRTATPAERGQALAAAASFKGYPYGGKNPAEGFDCSGLVCWAVQHSINSSFPNQSAQKSSASMQNPQPGLMPISPGQAGPGDLVLYPGHVGFFDPGNPDGDLFSARGDPNDLANSHGVDWAPRSGFKGTQHFFRLRVPCNR